MNDSSSPTAMYRMPVSFGPAAGPRSGPDGAPFDWRTRPGRELACIRFLTDAAALRPLLPPGCELDGEPIVNVELQNWTDLPWLDGRGYNTLGIKIPARVHAGGQTRHVAYLAVLWENMPDAILTGREELGYNKLFATLPDLPPGTHDAVQCDASWFGHTFCSFRLDDLRDAPVQDVPAARNDGVLNWKYIPGTGQDAPPDANYLTLSPPGGHTRITRRRSGTGTVYFHPTDWAQMPTQFHIVQTLARLPQHEVRDAFLVTSVGARDLSDMVRLDIDLEHPRT